MTYTNSTGYTYEGLSDSDLQKLFETRLKELEGNLLAAEFEQAEMAAIAALSAGTDDGKEAVKQVDDLGKRVQYALARIEGLRGILIPAPASVDQKELTARQ